MAPAHLLGQLLAACLQSEAARDGLEWILFHAVGPGRFYGAATSRRQG